MYLVTAKPARMLNDFVVEPVYSVKMQLLLVHSLALPTGRVDTSAHNFQFHLSTPHSHAAAHELNFKNIKKHDIITKALPLDFPPVTSLIRIIVPNCQTTKPVYNCD